jgi:uncharacterized membrane protein
MIPLLGSLASALLMPIFGAGLMLGCETLHQGGELSINHLFAAFKQKTGDLALVGVFNVVFGMVAGLAFFAVGGAGVFAGIMRGGPAGAGISMLSMLIAALLVAGLLVPVSMATWFAPALIMLQGIAPGAALKTSYFACLRNWIPFLIYGLALLFLCIFCALTLGLGYLVVVPVLIVSIYTSYRDIFCAG